MSDLYIGTDIGVVAITGATINLSDDITSDNDNITLTGAVVLNDQDIVITGGGGNIEFTSTVNSKANEGNALTIANTAGTATITGNIGTATNGALGNLTIGASGAGAITLSGTIGSSSAAGAAVLAVGNADAASITLGGVDYNTSGTQTWHSDGVAINGADATFTTSADNVTFTDGGSGNIVLAHS